MEDLVPAVAVVAIFIGLPWLILHYVTRWKTASTLTNEDETMLDELYQLARRLEERMETVERLVTDNDPEYRGSRPLPEDVTPLDFNQTKERTRR
jgi:phage shock protein B